MVICFLALVVIGVLGGAVMLLSEISVILPGSSPAACPDVDGCVRMQHDENEAALIDDDWIFGPRLTP